VHIACANRSVGAPTTKRRETLRVARSRVVDRREERGLLAGHTSRPAKRPPTQPRKYEVLRRAIVEQANVGSRQIDPARVRMMGLWMGVPVPSGTCAIDGADSTAVPGVRKTPNGGVPAGRALVVRSGRRSVPTPSGPTGAVGAARGPHGPHGPVDQTRGISSVRAHIDWPFDWPSSLPEGQSISPSPGAGKRPHRTDQTVWAEYRPVAVRHEGLGRGLGLQSGLTSADREVCPTTGSGRELALGSSGFIRRLDPTR
jgi:hypothetical protein